MLGGRGGSAVGAEETSSCTCPHLGGPGDGAGCHSALPLSTGGSPWFLLMGLGSQPKLRAPGCLLRGGM